MKNICFKNIVFIISFFIPLLLIIYLNYKADIYNVFQNNKYIDLYSAPPKYAQILIKKSENIKADTVVIGSSNTVTLFSNKDFYSYYFNMLCQNQMNYKQQYVLLKEYLKIHPETEEVFLFITYSAFWYEKGFFIKEDTFISNYFKDLMFLLLSIDTTKKSIQKLKNDNFKELFNFFKQKNIDNDKLFLNSNELLTYKYYPNAVPDFHVDINEQITIKNENIGYLTKIIKLLQEKNIKVKIIIPPHHALILSVINELPNVRETIDYVKKLCVDLTDEVYDFAVINKYTTVELNNKNYIFQDMLHSNFIMGLKIFKVLHNNLNEENLYVILNKNNIDDQLEKQKEQIKKFDKQNKSTIMDYYNFYYNNPNIDTMENETIYFANAPQYVKNEINTYQEMYSKINKLNAEKKPLKRGVFRNII